MSKGRWILLAVVLFALTACTCNGCQMATVFGNGDVTLTQGGNGWFNFDNWQAEDWAVGVVAVMAALCIACVFIAAGKTGVGME
jgi:hypothetical protein